MNFTLGTTLRDRVSGFVGIASSRSDFLTGNVQYGLQPPAKDGALPELIYFDAHQLESVPGPTVQFIEPPTDTGIVLGEQYEEVASGAVGIATKKVTFLNGCVYYLLVAERSSKGEFFEHFHEWPRLKRKGGGVLKEVMQKLNPPKKAATKTGGPIQRGQYARG